MRPKRTEAVKEQLSVEGEVSHHGDQQEDGEEDDGDDEACDKELT